MKKIYNYLDAFINRVSFLGPWILRILLGISFFIYGFDKFPLPSEKLMGFGFKENLAIFIPLVEVIGGIGIIMSGFIFGIWGVLLTRLFSFILAIFMIFALVLAHQDWLISVELFKNIQIYLLGVSLFFLFSSSSNSTN